MTTAGLRCDASEVDGAAVVRPRGVLRRFDHETLRESLVTAGVGEPSAVVVDLSCLDVPDPGDLALFGSVHEQLTQWPGVPLLLATDRAEHRERLAGRPQLRRVRVFPTVSVAIAAIGAPPQRHIVRRVLPNSLASARLARMFVQGVCAEWLESTRRARDVMTVVNELVENTLLHTYCAPSVRLELRRGLVTVAVYDDDPERARLVEPTPGAARNRGLVLVRRLARAWGCLPTAIGGKVVWAAF